MTESRIFAITMARRIFLKYQIKAMPESEGAPNPNSSEANFGEVEGGVNVEEKSEGELTPEEERKRLEEEAREEAETKRLEGLIL